MFGCASCVRISSANTAADEEEQRARDPEVQADPLVVGARERAEPAAEPGDAAAPVARGDAHGTALLPRLRAHAAERARGSRRGR